MGTKKLENYVVIDGQRFDFIDVRNLSTNGDTCSMCALEKYCKYGDYPCSVFNSSSEDIEFGHAFVNH